MTESQINEFNLALLEFVKRAASEGATAVEVEALPTVANALIRSADVLGTYDNEVHLSAKIDTSALDAVTREVERLNDLLKEASSLADELASKEINLSVEVED